MRTSAARSRKCAPATSPRRSGLKDVTTGDTLCDPKHVIHAREDGVPGARHLRGRRAEDQGRPGEDGHGAAAPGEGGPVVPLSRPTQESGQTIISGMGELHLEIIVDRMKREFKVEANVGKPQVAYRETIRSQGRAGRQVRPPVGRPRPVRPRLDHARAVRSRQGLRVRQRHRRRRRSEGIHSGGRQGHQGSDGERRARRLSGRGREGHADRRLVPRRRLERNGVQDRRLDGVQGRHVARRSRSSSSRS